MTERTDARAKQVALAVYHLRKSGYTNKEIALLQGIDVKRVPTLAKLGETLSTLEPTP